MIINLVQRPRIGIFRGGTDVLRVDDKEVAGNTMERSIPLILESASTSAPISARRYPMTAMFTGKLDKPTLTVGRPKLSPENIKKLQMTTRDNRAAE